MKKGITPEKAIYSFSYILYMFLPQKYGWVDGKGGGLSNENRQSHYQSSQ